MTTYIQKGAEPALEESRRADAAERAQQQPEIQCTSMQTHTLENVGVPAQMRASKPAVFVEMHKGSSQAFASQSQQTTRARTEAARGR